MRYINKTNFVSGERCMSEFQLLSVEETENLINLAQNGDNEAKEKLINSNYPLIKSIVRRFVGRGVEYDDLYQLGSLGFTKAINNFSTKFKVKFSTYAVPMIAGEIKRFLRDDGSIKISRSIKQLSQKINRYLDECKKKELESPTISQLAKLFEVDEQDIVVALDSNFCMVYLYDKTADKSENSPNLIDKIKHLDNEEANIEKIMLKDYIEKLEPKAKKIILLRYFRGMTQTEIARMLGVSQVQISRIEAKVLKNLKEELS